MPSCSILTRACSLLALLALATGCGPGGPTTYSLTSTTRTASAGPPVEALRAAVRGANAHPYSAFWVSSYWARGLTGVTRSGRANLAGTVTGRFLMRFFPGTKKEQTDEVVMTETEIYSRTAKGNKQPKGRWSRSRRRAPEEAGTLVAPGRYAELLLSRGQQVVKGKETVGGVEAVRLSAQVPVEDTRTLEPHEADRLRAESVESFDLDLWVDGSGRVVRSEQWLTLKGVPVQVVITLSKFAGPVTVSKPT